MKLDQKLVDAVKGFIEERFPDGEDFKGAAGAYTKSGKILISSSPLMPNACVDVCHETGMICEAFKIDEDITASICLSRAKGKYLVLSPCGVCMEILFLYGPNVEVGVPNLSQPTEWETKKLSDAHPYYWKNIFPDEK